MTPEEFQRLVARCQPHKVFSNEWKTFYSIDFADTLLPDVTAYKGKELWVYDGAELFTGVQRTDSDVLKLTNDKQEIAIVSYTYPKGVEAERKKDRVHPGDFEVCMFIEVAQDDSVQLFFKIGSRFRQVLKDYYKAKELSDRSGVVAERAYSTSIRDLKQQLSGPVSHYTMMVFIGNTIGVDLADVNRKNVFNVNLIKIFAQTSEPADNYKRKDRDKEKKRKYIIIEFEIVNRPAFKYVIRAKRGDEYLLYESLLSTLNVIGSQDPAQRLADDEGGTTIEYLKPGRYELVWDCTDNDVFDEKNQKQVLLFTIMAEGIHNQTSTAEFRVLVKELVENPDVNNFIIILEEQEDGSDIEIKLFGNEIIERQNKFVSRIPKNVFESISDKGKLILSLPIIMTKLNFLSGALCQINWLEGSRKSLKFPYDFFMSEERIENIDYNNLQEYFKDIKYISIENQEDSNTNNNDSNLFLFNNSIPSVARSLALFNEELIERSENGVIGDYDNISTHINQVVITKNNLFQSFRIGSALGDIDDVGTALGRYSQRCYFKGRLHRDTPNEKWTLSVLEVATRFADEFTFADDAFEWFDPRTWSSQNLGFWKTDTEKPALPVRTLPESAYGKISEGGNWLLLENVDYRKLKDSLSEAMNDSCNDFFIYSNRKQFTDEFLQKNIIIL